MIISLVAAASQNNVIGRGNRLPWHLPNDLKFLKNVTWAMPVAMGRRSFESIDLQPLNGRLNIIITRQKDFKAPGAIVVGSLDDAVFVAKEHDYKELMILGGGEIYKEAMPKADKIYITRVHTVIEDGDTFFPEIDTSIWVLTSNQDFPIDEKHAFAYSFQVWERR